MTDPRLRAVLDDLAAEGDWLDGLVAPLDEPGWRTPTPAGTLPRGPTLAIRLFRTTTSAFSTTSVPRIVTTRAPRSTTVPVGMSRGAATRIRSSSGR